MRRLPVYLLLDVSGSMTGEPIEALNNGIQFLISALRGEPQALETAYISIITFDNNAQQVVPLTDPISLITPELDAGGKTALGKALELLCSKIDNEVIKSTADKKGDWKPLVFLFTDGQPTDDWRKGAEEIKKRNLTIVACAAGFDADVNILKQITDKVIELKSASPSDITSFFKWATASISISSQKLENTTENESRELPPLPSDL